jgi:sulfite reductase (ferredoxin)
LEEFIPAEEVHLVAEAVKRVFDQHGNRRNRQKARLRFLLEQIGLSRFRELYDAELNTIRGAGKPTLSTRPMPRRAPTLAPSTAPPLPAFSLWRQRYVRPQKQEGFSLVHIPLTLGDIDADTLEKLSEIVEHHGEGGLRATQRQGFVIRWVHDDELPLLHQRLLALKLAGESAPLLANLVACTGAATCRLGICLSRGLAKAIQTALSASSLDLESLGHLRINISGCPNACGRHPIADIGLFGAARRVRGRLAPHYVLQLGGQSAEGQTKLAVGDQAIPARNVPALVAELLSRFSQSPQFPSFPAFLQSQDGNLHEVLVAKFQDVPEFTVDPRYYVDWDATDVFSLAGRGPGECGAGVFDLIEVDIENARDALKRGHPLEATVLAARALLVTRGQQARDESESLELFITHFLEEQLIESSFVTLLVAAKEASKSQSPSSFNVPAEEVARFMEAIANLYASMDASLRCKPAGSETASLVTEPAEPEPAATREADFRGVVCPLNYVKTKMLLDGMASGSILSVLLDEAGARNVPASVEKDGYEVLSVQQEAEQWRILIRKA